MTVNVPETLKAHLTRRAAATGHASVDQYVEHLIRADADVHDYPAPPGRSFSSDTELERELRRGIASGPAKPMTADEWDDLRREVTDRRNA